MNTVEALQFATSLLTIEEANTLEYVITVFEPRPEGDESDPPQFMHGISSQQDPLDCWNTVVAGMQVEYIATFLRQLSPGLDTVTPIYAKADTIARETFELSGLHTVVVLKAKQGAGAAIAGSHPKEERGRRAGDLQWYWSKKTRDNKPPTLTNTGEA